MFVSTLFCDVNAQVLPDAEIFGDLIEGIRNLSISTAKPIISPRNPFDIDRDEQIADNSEQPIIWSLNAAEKNKKKKNKKAVVVEVNALGLGDIDVLTSSEEEENHQSGGDPPK